MKMEIPLRPMTLRKSLLVTRGATVNKGPNETGVHNGHPGGDEGVRPAAFSVPGAVSVGEKVPWEVEREQTTGRAPGDGRENGPGKHLWKTC